MTKTNLSADDPTALDLLSELNQKFDAASQAQTRSATKVTLTWRQIFGYAASTAALLVGGAWAAITAPTIGIIAQWDLTIDKKVDDMKGDIVNAIREQVSEDFYMAALKAAKDSASEVITAQAKETQDSFADALLEFAKDNPTFLGEKPFVTMSSRVGVPQTITIDFGDTTQSQTYVLVPQHGAPWTPVGPFRSEPVFKGFPQTGTSDSPPVFQAR